LQQSVLQFLDLATRHPGVTPGMGAMLAEAARVCLDRHHEPPTQFSVGFLDEKFLVTATWVPSDEQMQAAYANAIDTTEWGAYCIALAAVEHVADFVAVHRAETGTGADYYVALNGTDAEDLEEAYRLEISGVDSGEQKDIFQRLQIKVQQVLKGSGNLPAMAAVVGFKARMVAADFVS
jgi:hypothetical protein